MNEEIINVFSVFSLGLLLLLFFGKWGVENCFPQEEKVVGVQSKRANWMKLIRAGLNKCGALCKEHACGVLEEYTCTDCSEITVQ